MPGKPKKAQREKDLTSRYLSGGYDEDRADAKDSSHPRIKARQQDRLQRTAIMRAEEAPGADIDTLPLGQVVQVHSMYCDVQHEGKTYLASVRRTLTKVSDGYVVVGDRVRFRPEDGEKSGADPLDAAGRADPGPRKDMTEAVIEQILPRQTLLTRADSFKGMEQHPIVANAEQMLIVASLRNPKIKWGLVDRMLVAAQCGKLKPIICLNKVDLASGEEDAPDVVQAKAAMAHYQSLGIAVLQTSAEAKIGIDELRNILSGRETVLAGHSGVGKSTLINAVQPDLNLRTAEISGYTGKGRHTTTSARRYPLDLPGGAVIDTPGVKLFGLWGLSPENLADYFPDIAAGTAPSWRQESYERIAVSLGK
jgi:ribosome biogenesis GTPase / thiamine phosphate phosphatase